MPETLDLTPPICCPRCAKEMEKSDAPPEHTDFPPRGLSSIPVRYKLTCPDGHELYVKDLGFTGADGQKVGERYWPQE